MRKVAYNGNIRDYIIKNGVTIKEVAEYLNVNYCGLTATLRRGHITPTQEQIIINSVDELMKRRVQNRKW